MVKHAHHPWRTLRSLNNPKLSCLLAVNVTTSKTTDALLTDIPSDYNFFFFFSFFLQSTVTEYNPYGELQVR
jgi:hypothetical protein